MTLALSNFSFVAMTCPCGQTSTSTSDGTRSPSCSRPDRPTSSPYRSSGRSPARCSTRRCPVTSAWTARPGGRRKAICGTGPFTVTSFQPDEKLELAANPTYWDGAPRLSELEFVNIPEVAGRITALENGEVDLLTQVPPDQVGSVKSGDGITYSTTPSWTYYFDWFNSNRKPFTDKRVRQAMWHALNLDGTIKDLLGDLASVAQAPLAQGVIGAPKLSPYSYDPAKAKQLLAEAGYPNGFSTSMQWPLEGGPNIRAPAQAMISDWAKIVVTVKPLEKERAQ